MGVSPRLEMRQGQSLVVTPQLQQAIKLLQLSNLELDSFVEAELERNPLLQRDDANGAEPGDAQIEPEHTPAISADPAPFEGGGAGDGQAEGFDRTSDAERYESVGERSGADGAEPEAGQAGGAIDWSRAGSGGSFEPTDDLEGALERGKGLAEHLADQLAVVRLTAAERAIALVLIDEVDEGGYLRADPDEIADRLGCRIASIEAVLRRLQTFEPTGVFARNLRECLMLQLKERDRCDPAMATLLDNLDLLARRDLAGLRQACRVDEEDLREMIAELKALTPRPGAAFGGDPVAPITPDVHVREAQGGLWHVELNSDTLPRLLLDQRYHARIAGGARSDADRTFVSNCLASANWLMKSLDQRARTILKVASEIVRQQDGFLAYGVEHLRPLNLKTVADAIGMHESTVSRVTSNKYIATPRGLFELKFFFTSAIASSDGGQAHSAESVRHRIRQLIEAERSDRDVHSDDRLVDVLKEAGVDIARRTVAKYREAMRIPSSAERRRRLKEAC